MICFNLILNYQSNVVMHLQVAIYYGNVLLSSLEEVIRFQLLRLGSVRNA